MPHLEDPFDRYRRQFQRIQEEHARQGRILVCNDLHAPSFAYDRDNLFVLDVHDNVDIVERTAGGSRVDESPRGGVQLMRLDGLDARDALVRFRDEVDRVRDGRGRHDACLDHLITVAEDVNLCPSDEPIPVPPTQVLNPDLAPTAAGLAAGNDVIIDVIDTGLAPGWDEHHWRAHIIEAGKDLLDRRPVAESEPIPLDYGHGTFITGILSCVAPQATIRVANDFRIAGAVTESMLRYALERTLTLDPKPQIISLSAGGTSECGSMLGLRDIVKKIVDSGIVLVAAAGNNGNDTPFYPAAFDGVISVGALRESLDGQACFSNYGRWVDVYAPGERLVNAFAYHKYVVQHDERETCRFRRRNADSRWYACCTCVTTMEKGREVTFNGLARWSGTSFATPIVAGLIAARKSSSSDQSVVDSATWLRRHPAGHIDCLGPIVLPGQPLTSRCTGDDCDGGC